MRFPYFFYFKLLDMLDIVVIRIQIRIANAPNLLISCFEWHEENMGLFVSELMSDKPIYMVLYYE